MREVTATLISTILRLTGYRFDKSFRKAESGWKAFIFAHVLNTTGANLKAGE